MLGRTVLRALIFGGTATAGDLHGLPSVTIDADLLDAADLDRLERIEVSPVDGGWTSTAFLLRGPRGSGEIRADGPAAMRLTDPTRVVITAWSQVDRVELATVRARLVTLSPDNQILEKLELGLVDQEEIVARLPPPRGEVEK